MYENAKSSQSPFICECAYQDTLAGGDGYLLAYNRLLRVNQSSCPNEKPDKHAPSDDPLVSTNTRENLIYKTLTDFEKSGFSSISDDKSAIGDENDASGGWVYHRQREDKREPNFQEVAMNTWRSIIASVDIEELKAVTKEIPEVIEAGNG